MKNVCLSEKSFCHHQEDEEEKEIHTAWYYGGTFNLHFGVEISKLKNSAGNLNSLLTSQCIITERVGSQICEQRATKCKKNSAVSIVCKFTSKDKINVFLKKNFSHSLNLSLSSLLNFSKT